MDSAATGVAEPVAQLCENDEFFIAEAVTDPFGDGGDVAAGYATKQLEAFVGELYIDSAGVIWIVRLAEQAAGCESINQSADTRLGKKEVRIELFEP